MDLQREIDQQTRKSNENSGIDLAAWVGFRFENPVIVTHRPAIPVALMFRAAAMPLCIRRRLANFEDEASSEGAGTLGLLCLRLHLTIAVSDQLTMEWLARENRQ
jgi:hypothetical protein